MTLYIKCCVHLKLGMVEWTPIKVHVQQTSISDPFTPPTDTTTALAARYLLIKTLVARQLLTNTHTHTHTHTHSHRCLCRRERTMWSVRYKQTKWRARRSGRNGHRKTLEDLEVSIQFSIIICKKRVYSTLL